VGKKWHKCWKKGYRRQHSYRTHSNSRQQQSIHYQVRSFSLAQLRDSCWVSGRKISTRTRLVYTACI